MSVLTATLQPAAAAQVLAGGSNSSSADTPAPAAEPFAALFQQLIGKQAVADPTAGMLLLQGDTSSDSQVGEYENTDLAALLPFMEAMGLAQSQMPPAMTEPAAVTQTTAIPAAVAKTTATTAATTAIPAALAQAVAANSADSIAGQPPQDSENILYQAAGGGQSETAGQIASTIRTENESGNAGQGTGEFKAQLDAALSEGHNDNQDVAQHANFQTSVTHAMKEKAASTTQFPVSQPVGSSTWGSEIGNRVVIMAGNRDSHAELILTPPQMGRIEVSLTVSGDQATANFVSGNPVVREALESALPRLREILAEAGIQLGQAQVGAENPKQTAQQEKDGNKFSSMKDSGSGNTLLKTGSEQTHATASLKISRGLVDVFA